MELIKLPDRKKPTKEGVVWTPTMEAVLNRVEFMLAKPTPEIGLLIGGWGMGKSAILRAMESRWRRLITIDTATASLRRGLFCIANVMGHHEAEWRWATRLLAHDTIDLIEAHMRDARVYGERFLLMFDESQLMTIELIETVRAVHDRTGCPVLFAGNPEWRAQLTQDKFGAFFTRVFTHITLKRPQTGDVAAFCHHHEIAGAREQSYLEGIAGRHGALRNLVKVIETARSIAGDKAIRLEHLKEGARDCGLGAAGSGE